MDVQLEGPVLLPALSSMAALLASALASVATSPTTAALAAAHASRAHRVAPPVLQHLLLKPLRPRHPRRRLWLRRGELPAGGLCSAPSRYRGVLRPLRRDGRVLRLPGLRTDRGSQRHNPLRGHVALLPSASAQPSVAAVPHTAALPNRSSTLGHPRVSVADRPDAFEGRCPTGPANAHVRNADHPAQPHGIVTTLRPWACW